MAFYLVQARPLRDRMPELVERLKEGAFKELRPFGKALTYGLKNARVQQDGTVVWEEEDYCVPPLAAERKAVLDTYFTEIVVAPVNRGEGWQQIHELPRLIESVRLRAKG